MPRPTPAGTSQDSRAATNKLLAELHAGGWTARAWARFLCGAGRRSAQQALLHPRALAEVTLLHGILLSAAGHHRRQGIVVSWALAATHLGMLGSRDTLGIPNLLTLLRANLPAIGSGLGRWLGATAVVTDLIDGRIARATGAETHFGSYADPLADAAFWTRFARSHEHDRLLRGMPILVWGLPATAVTIASIRRGRMIERPRPELLRLGAVLEVLLAVRAARNSSPRNSPASHGHHHGRDRIPRPRGRTPRHRPLPGPR